MVNDRLGTGLNCIFGCGGPWLPWPLDMVASGCGKKKQKLTKFRLGSAPSD